MTQYNFDKNAAKRLVTDLKRGERSPLNGSRASSGRRGGGRSNGLWGRLIAVDDDGKYSWQPTKMSDDGKMIVDPDSQVIANTEPSGWAIELGCRSKHCCINDFVWLTPAVTDGVDYMVFNYAGVMKEGDMPSTDINAGAKGTVTIKYYNGDSVTKSDQQVEARNGMGVKATKSKKCFLTFNYGWVITGVSC